MRVRHGHESQRSRIQAVEMSYLRGACGLNMMDDKNNEGVYGKFVMSLESDGINCGVVEEVKCSNLRWSGHLERMEGDELTKRIYKSGVDAVGVKRRPTIKWEDNVRILEGEWG